MESEDVGLGKAKASLSLFLAFEGEGDQDWDPKWCLFPLKKTNHLVLLGWGVSIPPLLILCGSTIWSHYQWPLPLCPPPWYGGTFQRFRQVHPPISFSNLIGMTSEEKLKFSYWKWIPFCEYQSPKQLVYIYIVDL